MDYHAVQQIILGYADEKAVDFADKFSRFPCNPVAGQISAFLRMRAGIYRTFDPEAFEKINLAADTIDKRAEY